MFTKRDSILDEEGLNMMEAAISELDQTIDLLERMTEEELQAVHAVAIVIMNKNPVERPFQRQTEDEFFARVDEGLAELDTGLGEDSDLVNAEIAAEFGLAM